MPNDAERQSMQGAHFDEVLTTITATRNEIFIKRQHRQPFRFANIAQRHEIYLSTINNSLASANVGRAQMLFKLSSKFTQIMLIRLIRNQPQGTAITGRLVINGRFFCNTLERKGYEIPALCYPVRVTMSPRFKRLLPIVQNVPRRSGIRFHRGTKPQHSTGCILVVADNKNDIKNKDNLNNPCARPTLALAKDDISLLSQPLSNVGEAEMLSMLSLEKTETLSSKHSPVGARSVAEVENQLTQLLLQSQNDHEAVILEVIDFRPGTEYGYNTPCPIEIQKR